MTEYTTSSHAFREYMSSRDRTARWVRSHPPTESKFYSPSLPPSVIDELVPSSPPSEADSSHSTPPKMVLRYNDGRPDIPIPRPVPGHAMRKQGSKVYGKSAQTSPSRVRSGSSSESPVFNSSPRHDHESSLLEEIRILPSSGQVPISSRPSHVRSKSLPRSSLRQRGSAPYVPFLLPSHLQNQTPYYDQGSLAMGPQAISPQQQVNFAQPTHPLPPKYSHPKHTPPAIVYVPSHRSHQPHYAPPAMFHHPPRMGPNGMIYSHSAAVSGQYPPAYPTPPTPYPSVLGGSSHHGSSPQTSASRVTRVRLGSSSESPVSNSSSRRDWRRTSSAPTISRPASVSSERDTNHSSLSGSTIVHAGSTLNFTPLPSVVTPHWQNPIAEPPFCEVAAEAQESIDPSPLTTSSEIVFPTLPPSVEETQDPTGRIPPVIDSTVGDPGAFADVNDLSEVDTDSGFEDAQVLQAVAPYIVEPMAESIKDFEPADHANNTVEFSEAVHGKDNVISHEPSADLIASRITQPVVLDMPQPEFADQGPAETHSHSPIVMHLPSFDDVITSIPIHHAPYYISSTENPIETQESLPLSRPARPFKHIPSSYFKTCPRDLVSISPPVYSTSQSTTSNGNTNSWPLGAHSRLHTLGWLEYHLLNGTVYYVHPTIRVTTEIKLINERMLNGVERFLADSGSAMEGTLASGGEIWLKDVGTANSGLVLEAWLVDHRLRTVVIDGGENVLATKGSENGKAKNVFTEEDQLDTEFRYWSFMEAYPAHNSFPAEAKMEAMDVLRWAWTERLFPSHCAIPAPFTQEEGQELMTLIRSFDDDHDDHGIQTRILSRVFLEVAHWRQTYFRPNNPLPTNVGPNQSRLPMVPRQPFKWVIIDFFISCLFLCIPYMFFERTYLSTRIVDEESGLRDATSTLVIGAYTCFVAAVVLSASLTFYLPGLDSFSRATGMVAILFAAFSMAATVVAIFGHKIDLETSNITCRQLRV